MILAAGAAPVEVGITVGAVEVAAGSGVAANVHIRATREVKVRAAEVALAARVTYRYRDGGLLGSSVLTPARRTDVHATHIVPGPWPIAAGESVVVPVTLTVPAHAPGTSHTPVVDITWVVRVRIQAEGYLDAEEARSFVVRSPAADRAHVATGDPVVEDRRRARVRIEELASRSVRPGRPVVGTLVVEPLRPVSARAVRAAVVLRQDVHHGEWVGDDPSRNPANQELSRDTVVSALTLAEGLVLVPGEPRRLPFTLLMPEDLPAPSLSTPNFTLSWLLRGWVDLPLRPDPFVELELHASTMRDGA